MTDLTRIELMQTIARVRRAMPRNKDVMDICEAAERADLAPSPDAKATSPVIKFDKKTYQRELMRKRRAAGKA